MPLAAAACAAPASANPSLTYAAGAVEATTAAEGDPAADTVMDANRTEVANKAINFFMGIVLLSLI